MRQTAVRNQSGFLVGRAEKANGGKLWKWVSCEHVGGDFHKRRVKYARSKIGQQLKARYFTIEHPSSPIGKTACKEGRPIRDRTETPAPLEQVYSTAYEGSADIGASR